MFSGGVVVWGCFSANGIGKHHKVKGKVDSEHNINILKFCAVPSMKNNFQISKISFSKTMHLAIPQRRLKSGSKKTMLKLYLGQETVQILTPSKMCGIM